MPADIAEVIRAAAPDGEGLGILELLDIDLVISSVAVVLYAEGNGLEELVIFDQFNIANGMDLFSPANHFIGPIGIYILNKVR